MPGTQRPSLRPVLLALALVLTVLLSSGLAAVVLPSGVLARADRPATTAESRTASPAEVPLASPTPAVGSVASHAASVGGRVASRDLFPPSPAGAPNAPRGSADVSGYPSVPAPMGIADLGVGASGAYEYNTSGFLATITFQSPFSVYSPGYAAFAESPSWASIQLNAVATNVSYPGGVSAGTFWVQSVVHFNGTELQFEDNIWDFSSPTAVLEADMVRGNGSVTSYSGTGYYFDLGPTIPRVAYPLTLGLTLNLTLVDHETVVRFGYTVSDALGRSADVYDSVTFLQGQAITPAFQVNGKETDPAGHWNDAELIFGGDGSGSNAMVQGLNASVRLQDWSSTFESYVNVPSAYDYGIDSGETSEGIAATYNASTHVETLEQGPSMLYGLWGTATSSLGPAAAPGAIELNVTLTPSWGFVFVTTNVSYNENPLSRAGLADLPLAADGAGTTDLPPPSAGDPYVVVAWAAGYLNSSTAPVRVLHGGTVPIALTAAPTDPLQAPVYLDSYGQAVGLGELGIPGITYTPSNLTLTITGGSDLLAAPFLRLNDYAYPTFVLFAASGLNVSVAVNGFSQSPAASEYVVDLGGEATYPGYLQGYYFDGGNRSDAVTNVTLPGNSTAFYDVPTYPPAAVEFYGTDGSRASNIVSSQESFGVVFVNATRGEATNLTSEAGANGLVVVGSSYVNATNVASVGGDFEGEPSWGIYLDSTGHDVFTDVRATGEASGGSLGLYVSNATDWTVTNLTVLNAIGVEAFNGSYAKIVDMKVTEATPYLGASLLFAGFWSNSTAMALRNVSDVGLGLIFEDDTSISVVGLNASGSTSVGVVTALGTVASSFSSVNATDGAVGLNLTGGSDLTVSSVDADGASLGVFGLLTNSTNASAITAAAGSIGFAVEYGQYLNVSGVTATGGSTGVVVTNASNVSVDRVSADSASLGRPFLNVPALGLVVPSAAVFLGDVANASVDGVSAINTPYGLFANYTNGSVLVDVAAYDGDVGLALNYTNNTTVSQLFAYGQTYGVQSVNATNLTVEASTIEDSASYGLVEIGGDAVVCDGDNFVANNGASATGAFSSSHVQAYADDATDVAFAGNYWSDSPSRDYAINRTTEDRSPAAAFLGNWLAFQAVGLGSGVRWTVGFYGARFGSAAPLVTLPAWAVPGGSQTYVVNPPADYVADPALGSVTFTGANRTVTIDFNYTGPAPGGSGVPLWAIAAGAGAAIVGVGVVVALVLRSRTGRQDQD